MFCAWFHENDRTGIHSNKSPKFQAQRLIIGIQSKTVSASLILSEYDSKATKCRIQRFHTSKAPSGNTPMSHPQDLTMDIRPTHYLLEEKCILSYCVSYDS